MQQSQKTLLERWLTGDLSVCENIVADLEPSRLVSMAVRGLVVCCSAVEAPPPELAEVVRIGQTDWGQGHATFDAVRKLTLEWELGQRALDDPNYVLLFVGENASRVIYNASNPGDSFDEDSGAWLLLSMSQFVHCLPKMSRDRVSSMLADILQQCLKGQTQPA